MTTRGKLAAGNWKMNGQGSDLQQIETLRAALDRGEHGECGVLICPPATLLERMARLGGENLALGGQDCHAAQSGAHTGDISAPMLADAGASHVIVGHSERRGDHDEQDADIRAKAEAAHGAGLTAIVCIGETLEEREAGRTLDTLCAQLAGSLPDGASAANTVVAYEPIWAIGTGKVPQGAQIAEVHDRLRSELETRFGEDGAGIRLLYGGSVKASNAAEIFAIDNVDGALVGGASLKADDFLGIIAALAKA
ncbi:triose-phosphate isomerase [Profundibacterium mesophilum]|uniref:Triosephosphate isomerase n=1 Tax=Profundibacterium mesophilum KAUST100406-0324 TaxID=1037889 RepID=A0A921NYD3_9RHOB|nr:triose-phosphate isomerase [Profundibacterium mesophilum]KAF0677635.1 Triosephosphate isomerase [Profundibacterium mesophilum KAUST100406-0324]